MVKRKYRTRKDCFHCLQLGEGWDGWPIYYACLNEKVDSIPCIGLTKCKSFKEKSK